MRTSYLPLLMLCACHHSAVSPERDSPSESPPPDTDVPETYSDADYALGMDAVRMTAGALGELSGPRAVE